ncbi:MAG: endonuclease [Paludibacteraceae bacterium]|nr:endonuclease [Paludibacteraceae bacterium]
MASVPTGYYDGIDGKKGDAVLDALHKIIDGHTSISYSGLEPYYARTDLTSQGYIWDMYSLCTFTMSDANGGQKRVCDCWNKEHSVPQSYFNEASPMKSDLFHVYPTDARVNNFRSNYPYGETSSTEYVDGDKKALGHIGSSNFSGYSGKIYEPDDEYKGDLARTYFYMVTRYLDKNFTQSANGSATFTYSNGRAGLTSYGVRLLLKWHRQDPVSSKEIARNDAVYGIQHNRNPFIDYPCLVEYIWGDNKADQLDMATIMVSSDSEFMESDRTGCNCAVNVPTLLTPKKGTTIAIGSASVGETASSSVYVSGTLLDESLTCTISGTNADMFHFAKGGTSYVMSADAANYGMNLSIVYEPTATGSHTATLTIHSPELKEDRAVTITGKSIATLVQPVTGEEYTFAASGVKDVITQQIFVKGTNLTLPLYVGLAYNKGDFSVSPASLTAQQVNEGTYVAVTYAPSSIGTAEAKLIINSNEFTQPTITLRGDCLFELETPDPVYSNSATLHWTDAGAQSYLVDVFFLTQEEKPEVVILDDAMGNNAAKVQYYDTSTKGYIRLGSGSKGGSISYSGLDLSNGGLITITAKAYNSTDGSQMKVTVNGASQSFELSTSDVDYTITVEPGASSSSTVKIESPAKSQRLYVKNVKVTTGGTKEVRTSLLGYPRQETFLSHKVSGLTEETEYFYQVTPQGLNPSEVETFVTTDETETDDWQLKDDLWNAVGAPAKFLNGDGHLLLRSNQHLYSAHGLQLR